MIRTEVKTALTRWRGVIIAALIGVFGLRLLVATFGFMPWIGGLLVVLSVVMIVSSLQRMRFSSGRGGPGVVQIIEGQLSYFGPLDGGAVALTEMTRIELDPTCKPACWRFYQTGQSPLHIPVNAEGADQLFDMFARLPGIDTSKMLDQLRGNAQRPVVIWRKDDLRLH
ncbi:hypothetical protein HJ526_03815 [Donghicola sp. C2-DW-16]|uniref:Uncharacterized protein n=1 Tax=Donghicola mangrovi TaxID=2729614 RepID=A0A850Q5N5_9RHOB|nr:hypothetical protein [Donghicola mangrovi]NVO21875.1 hypothetical protein [Donghicola mangrovi]NVO26536.1 hypothetical protein [Donghicola mangrovi]